HVIPGGLKGCRVVIASGHIAQKTTHFFERVGINPAVVFNAVMRSRPELLEIPISFGHADDRHSEVSALDHRLQGRKNLFVRQIPGRTEKDQSIRMGTVHSFLLMWWIFPGVHRTHSAAPRAVYLRNLPRRAS